MNKRMFRIIQESKYRWRVENAKGDVMVQGLMIGSTMMATTYIKCYVSSFICYDYEVVPLTTNKGLKSGT